MRMPKRLLAFTLDVLLVLSVFSLLALNVWQIKSVQATTYGKTSVGASVYHAGGGLYHQASKISVTSPIDATAVFMYCNSNRVEADYMAIRNDSGGDPTNASIIGKSIATTPETVMGWVSFNFSSPIALSVGYYWVEWVYLGSENGLDFFAYDTTGGVMQWGSGYNWTNAYLPWTNEVGTQTWDVSVYISGTEPSGGDTSLQAKAGYNYTLGINSTSCYVFAENNTVVYSNTDPTFAFGNATVYANNTGANGLYILNGTYLASSGKFFGVGLQTGCDINWYIMNLGITCSSRENPANFTISASLNKASVQVWCSINITITNIWIDANRENQNPTGAQKQTTDCILVWDSSNVLITNSTLTQAWTYGYSIGVNNDRTYVVQSCGITYCDAYDCGWNGIVLCDNLLGVGKGNYAMYNEVWNCSDVGISDWSAISPIIAHNYVHDINGTYGWAGVGTGSHWGIADEGGYYALIENNTIVNCPSLGIAISNGDAGSVGCLVKNNTVTMCPSDGELITGVCIVISGDGYHTVTNNTLTQWNFGYNGGGIYLHSSDNCIISFNTLTNDQTPYVQEAIRTEECYNVTIANNTITMSKTPTYSMGIHTGVASSGGDNCNNTLIYGNIIDTKLGIWIDSTGGSTDTKISGNNLTSCTTEIDDDGINTLINPTSCDNYTLRFNSHYDGSAKGTYTYSNTTRVYITLPSGGVLNVDGTNHTVTVGSNYNFLMDTDHFAYSFASATIGTSNVLVTLNYPTNTTYTSSSISVNFSASGGTIDKQWFNCKNASSWIYGSNQTYTTPTTMTGFVNGTSYTFYGWANNTLGDKGESTMMFSVTIYGVEVTLSSPTNSTYTSSNVTVTFSAVGGTIDKKWFNCKNGTSWIYGSNQTYTASTNMTGFINGTSYAFYAWANNTLGDEGSSSVMFNVGIYVVPPTDLSYVAVGLNSPVNGYSTTSTVITFTYTPYTTSTFENASLYLNVSGTWQSAGLNTTAILNNTVNSWTYMFLTYGTFVWNIQVYNTTAYAFANANFTLTLTVPTLPPSTGNVFYFCPDTQTINTVTGYKLSETQPNSNASASISASGNVTGYVAYRVFIVYDDGTMFEISSGYIAITGRTNDTEGLINATWTCPRTSLNVGFQALRVEMYMQIGSGGWIDKATFISGFLNETEITASTWIFQTYTKHAYTGGSTILTATWGTSIANSLIDNVGVTDPGIYDLLIYQLNMGNFVGFIFMPYTNLVGNLFYGLLLLVFFVPLYNRYKSFSPIIILLILFGGAGGILSLMVPEAGLGISWIFLVVGIGGLIYKVFR